MIGKSLKRIGSRCSLLLSAATCIGCQSADPLAVFGPYKVPPPTTTQLAAPYYPPTGTTAQQPPDKTSPPRMSVSAETQPLLSSPARLASDPADRTPIRVVENPAANTRTAAATNRGVSASVDSDSAAPSTATAK